METELSTPKQGIVPPGTGGELAEPTLCTPSMGRDVERAAGIIQEELEEEMKRHLHMSLDMERIASALLKADDASALAIAQKWVKNECAFCGYKLDYTGNCDACRADKADEYR